MAIAPPINEIFPPESPAPPTEPLEIEYEEIEEALLGLCEDGLRDAIPLSQGIKRKWALYLEMKQGFAVDDEGADDDLAQMDLADPVLAKFIDILKAEMLKELLPDPAEMDFFALLAKWPGVEPYAEAMTEQLRDKFRVMKPKGATNFYDFVARQVEDYATVGNCLSVMGHELLQGDEDGDGVIQGPTAQYVDPFNAWPWRTDINCADETAWTLYAPITTAELRGGGYRHVQRVLEEGTTGSPQMRDPKAGGAETEQYYEARETQREPLWERYVDIMPWPGGDLRERLGEDYEESYNEAGVLRTLGGAFGFDPARLRGQEWWVFERIGPVLIMARPFPLKLPMGRCPIHHGGFLKVNGRLWAHGLYDRAANDERFSNFFKRAIVRLTAMNARPPVGYYPHLIDQTWLQQRGEDFRFEPDLHIPMLPTAGEKQPFAEFHINPEAIPLLDQQRARHEKSMRESTGILSAVEGSDQSDTATQSSNNLAQSMSVITFWTKEFEHVWLRETVLRAYLVMAQAMKLMGQNTQVPISMQQGLLQMLELRPEHLLGEAYIDVRMQGTRSGPGNRQERIQNFERFVTQWLPTGMLNLVEAMKTHADELRLSSKYKLVMDFNQASMQARMMNILSAFGPNGLQAMGMMGPAPALPQPMQPGGAGDRGTPSEPGAQGRSNLPQMRAEGPIGAPMMPGRNTGG